MELKVFLKETFSCFRALYKKTMKRFLTKIVSGEILKSTRSIEALAPVISPPRAEGGSDTNASEPQEETWLGKSQYGKIKSEVARESVDTTMLNFLRALLPSNLFIFNAVKNSKALCLSLSQESEARCSARAVAVGRHYK